jgi:multimeric flavodoxin WrbA
MKVTTILGSPRKRGNTARVIGWIEDELRELGHEAERIILVDRRVKGCKGCYACKNRTEEPRCPRKDDAAAIFNRMAASEAIVYATPLYCWCFSSQMKALIDRHLCIVSGYGTPEHASLIEGRRAALVVTCEDVVENNADIIQVLFDRLNEYTKCSVAGKYVFPNCSTPDAMGADVAERAKQIAREIANGA